MATAKELTRGCHNWPDVDQTQRRDLVGIADRHALAHNALHAQEADAQLVLNQFAHRLNPTVAQVINIIWAPFAIIDLDNAANHRHQILIGEDTVLNRRGDTQPPIDLVATDTAHIIAA